jgi:hypothetical protein
MGTKTKKQKIPLEKLALGKAKVMVLKTSSGSYGLHGQTGWDDLPYWESQDAWIASVQVHGRLDWKGKYRESARKEHSGTGEIQLAEHRISRSERESEDYALEQAIKLEEMGFEVELDFGEIGRTVSGIYHEWIEDAPPYWLANRIANRIDYSAGRLEDLQNE